MLHDKMHKINLCIKQCLPKHVKFTSYYIESIHKYSKALCDCICSSRIECWVIRWPFKLQTKMDVFLRHLQLDDTILANCVAGKLITAEQMNAIEFVNGRVALVGKRKFFDLMVKMSPLSVSALVGIFDKELNEPMAQALQQYLDEVLHDMGLSLHDFSDRKRKSSNIDVRTLTVRY